MFYNMPDGTGNFLCVVAIKFQISPRRFLKSGGEDMPPMVDFNGSAEMVWNVKDG